MSNHDSRGIYDAALDILSELAPDAIPPDPAQLIIGGNGSTIESIVLVNLILSLEEELSSRHGLTIDLVDFLARIDGSITFGQFARELEARIAKA